MPMCGFAPPGNWALLHGYAPALITPLHRSLRKVGPVGMVGWWGYLAPVWEEYEQKVHLAVMSPIMPVSPGVIFCFFQP